MLLPVDLAGQLADTIRTHHSEDFVVIIFLKACVSIPAPNRPPGNVSWKTQGSFVTVRWDHVTAMHNESAVLGYKVSFV